MAEGCRAGPDPKLQEEADARQGEARAEGAQEPKARKGAPVREPARMKIVWASAVNGSIVKTFPYPQKESAEAEVKRLSEEKPHHLRAEKVPFDA
jgi:hypothetical protein